MKITEQIAPDRSVSLALLNKGDTFIFADSTLRDVWMVVERRYDNPPNTRRAVRFRDGTINSVFGNARVTPVDVSMTFQEIASHDA